MSYFDPNQNVREGHSHRNQEERRTISLLSDLSKSIDAQHHNSSLYHQFGGAFDVPQTVSDNSSDIGYVGQAESPARADHRHGVEPTDWVFPTLGNSWTNYGGGWAPAAYTKVSGFVHLQGLITGGTMGAVIFVLPVGYRPVTGNLLFATVCGNAFGRLNVMANGDVYYEPGIGGSNAFGSLNCVFLTG